MRSTIYTSIKRGLDLIFSFFLIIVLIPAMLVLVILIRVDSQGSILFGQKRVGRDKKNFIMWKFRTMRIDTPSNTPTHLLENPSAYITSVGKFLRKFSLDELPQLFNILKGDMSFVGPRPALWNQYDLIAARDRYNANGVLPGLTGLAQISGRDELPIDVKAKIDGEYVKNVCFVNDLKIVFMTFIKVASADGVKEGRKS